MPIYVPLPIMNILGASVLFFFRVPESVRFLARRHSDSWHHVRILSVVIPLPVPSIGDRRSYLGFVLGVHFSSFCLTPVYFEYSKCSDQKISKF
jgi:hypothetical protein